jgi:NADPH:quinone reductase-like Zn-dependent oxidoreductase
MRGFGFREHGGLERLEFVEIPEPEPGPGEVRVAIRAAAFNRLDRFTLAGIPGVTYWGPTAPGSSTVGGRGWRDSRAGRRSS